MCGINGIYGISDEYRTKDLLVHMNSKLAHRGPDAQGIFTRGAIGLGHRRLSIIDLSDLGRQPMLNAGANIILAFNGEIYNYKKLKPLCKDFDFKTNTDSEVVLAMYEKYGVNCFEQFQGMFALAIWDDREKNLILARDRMGKKPLYYAIQDDIIVFSSEIRGILATGIVKPVLSQKGLSQYMQFQTVYSPNTILENIKMLEAGSFAVASGKLFDIKRYWKIDRAKEKYSLTGPYDKVVKQTRELFFSAVEKRLMSDVPLGAFLSGGIDSSSVVAAMAELQTEKVKTFNVYFDDENFNESEYAQLVANKFKTEHYGIKVNPLDFLAVLPNALQAMDHPSADGPNTYIVAENTKRAGITVALSGIGGDELFGGYPVFDKLKQFQKFKLLGKLPVGLRAMGINLIKNRITENQLVKLRQIALMKRWNWTDMYPVFRSVYTAKEMKDFGLFKGEFANQKLETEGSGFRFLSEISIAESKTYLENVLLRDTDQMSMAHSLEVRAPFLDTDLIEFVLSLPDDFKPIKPPKKLLIDALGNLLPREVWDRPKKGFVLPWKHWINRELAEFCEENIKYLEEVNLFNSNFIAEIRRSMVEPTNENWFKVWNLVVLGYWLQKNNVKFE